MLRGGGIRYDFILNRTKKKNRRSIDRSVKRSQFPRFLYQKPQQLNLCIFYSIHFIYKLEEDFDFF